MRTRTGHDDSELPHMKRRRTVGKELMPQETAAILQRILDAVEKDDRNRWVEIACAVLLSLAMMASAWCAYQSNLWSGVQTFRLAAESKAGRESTKATLAALQMRAFDAAMLINYLQAKTQGNQRLEKILYDRFRPEMKTAVEAWLKTDPFNNPAAPPSPFKMAEYVQKELRRGESLRGCRLHRNTLPPRRPTRRPTPTSCLPSCSLRCCSSAASAGVFRSRRLRISFFVIALVLFVVTVVIPGNHAHLHGMTALQP